MDATADKSRSATRVEGTPGDVWKLHASTALPDGVARDGARYELLAELASGGMATVYLARMVGSMGLSRLVAIKSMHPQYAKDPSFASMFVDEARLTARLRHPNVVPTLDIVADGGHLLIVMEYVEGESLAALIKLVREAGDVIPAPFACAILHDALLGLHEAHEARDDDGSPLAIVHRDVSPQNVIVGLDGLARVLDFGVAKARRTVHFSHDGEIKGKVPYMPPEQLFGEGIDRRVDVYAAGVLLWEALVGARLFEGPTEEIIVKRIADGAVPAPSTRAKGISPEIDAIVLKALSGDPTLRFSTALEMAERLAAAVTLPARTDVASWVKKYARVRSKISTAPSTREMTPTTTDVGALVAGVRRSHASARSTSPRAMVVAFAAIAIACGAVALFSSVRSGHDAQAATPPKETAPAIVVTNTVPAPEPVVTTTALEQPAAVASAKPKTIVVAKPAPSPTVVEKKIEVAPEKKIEAVDPKANCRPPYTIDAEGHRHYKVECI